MLYKNLKRNSLSNEIENRLESSTLLYVGARWYCYLSYYCAIDASIIDQCVPVQLHQRRTSSNHSSGRKPFGAKEKNQTKHFLFYCRYQPRTRSENKDIDTTSETPLKLMISKYVSTHEGKKSSQS